MSHNLVFKISALIDEEVCDDWRIRTRWFCIHLDIGNDRFRLVHMCRPITLPEILLILVIEAVVDLIVWQLCPSSMVWVHFRSPFISNYCSLPLLFDASNDLFHCVWPDIYYGVFLRLGFYSATVVLRWYSLDLPIVQRSDYVNIGCVSQLLKIWRTHTNLSTFHYYLLEEYQF